MLKKFFAVTVIALAFSFALFMFFDRDAVAPTEDANNDNPVAVEPTPTEPVETFDKTLYSRTDPTSIWVTVNKRNGIPTDYIPELIVPNVRLRLAPSQEQMQISPQVEDDLETMFAAASEDNVQLVFGSGYRSAALQKQFYDSYVATDGQELADTYSARPGHSEHQTGFAVDITSPSGTCHLEICWENTPEGKWVAENAHRFGFIIRYQEGKESITGYQYEPWHLRYVGTELSQELFKTGLTYEEFFDLPRAPDYL
jgi:D-alanyl-D-alanine carboxypeptidase